MYSLMWLIILIGFGMLGSLFGPGPDGEPPGFLVALLGVLMLASFIPGLAVTVRRFHDQDRSGWFVLLSLIPIVGGLIMLVFMLLPGTAGQNRFGADPKSENLPDAAS